MDLNEEKKDNPLTDTESSDNNDALNSNDLANNQDSEEEIHKTETKIEALEEISSDDDASITAEETIKETVSTENSVLKNNEEIPNSNTPINNPNQRAFNQYNPSNFNPNNQMNNQNPYNPNFNRNNRQNFGGYGGAQNPYNNINNGGYGGVQNPYNNPINGGYGGAQNQFNNLNNGGYGGVQNQFTNLNNGGYGSVQNQFNNLNNGGYGGVQNPYNNVNPSQNIPDELKNQVNTDDFTDNVPEFSTTSNIPSDAPTKKSNGLAIFAIILLVLFICVAIIVAIFMDSDNSDLPNPLPNTESGENTPINPDAPDIEIITKGDGEVVVPQGEGIKLSPKEIYAKAHVSVVGVETSDFAFALSTGTGIVLSEDGYIITNYHVVEDGKFHSILMHDGVEFQAELVGFDEKTDLAVLKINPTDEYTLIPAEFGNSDALVVGDPAYAIGNPGGFELLSTFTDGLISAINRDFYIENTEMKLIQTNTAINPGNSGGPLINEYGQVIGITTIKLVSEDLEGLGFAIPMAIAEPILEEIMLNGHVTGRPSIGITGRSLSETEAEFNDVPQGLYIESVDIRSDAYTKGVKQGDILYGVNGTETATVSEVNDIKEQFKAGDSIVLNLYRAGKYIDIEIILMDENDLETEVDQDEDGYYYEYDENFDEDEYNNGFIYPFG